MRVNEDPPKRYRSSRLLIGAKWEQSLRDRDLPAVMQVQIEIALASVMERSSILAHLEGSARALGLSGAEIDAAKRGRSFDAVIDVAIAYALALHMDDRKQLMLADKRVAGFGWAFVTDDVQAIVANHQNGPSAETRSLED